VEFFDDPEKIDVILAHLAGELESGHVVSWLATVND
jgi:hypothetical protein